MLPTWQAFLWVLWRQHRWGLLFVWCAWIAAAILATLVSCLFSKYDTDAMGIFGLVVFPLTSLSVYHLIIFTYGLDAGDIVGSDSCFPTHLFRLPVRTGTLVFWPMAIGALAVFVVCLATSVFVLLPWLELWIPDAKVPLWWPGMMVVAILAWFQAILWTPFGLPWLRVVAVLTVVQGMIAVPIYGTHDQRWLLVFFTGLAVTGWVLGYLGVRRARHGDVPNWSALSAFSDLVGGSSQMRPRFASADQAQNWLEWRATGKAFPIMVAVMLPLAFLQFVVTNFNTEFLESSLLCTLGIPFLTASAAGWFGSRRNRWAKGRNDMMPFIAALPMTTASMLRARFKAAAWTTVITWGIVVGVSLLAGVLTRHVEKIVGNGLWRNGIEVEAICRFAAGSACFILLLLIWTWKRNLDSLFVGLIPNKAIEIVVAWGSIPGTYLLYVYVAAIYIESHDLSRHNLMVQFILVAWPWFLGSVLLLRLLIAGWALREAMWQGILQPRAVQRWAMAWFLLAGVLIGLLTWAMPKELPTLDLAVAVVFILPIVRLAAAPLALAWSRHR